jgi:hypothetical protein
VTTFEEILAQAKRPRTSVQLCLRGDLTAPYVELEQRLRTASRTSESLGKKSDAVVIAEQMRALEAEMAAASTTFVLEAMHPKAFSDFVATQPERAKDETDEALGERLFGWAAELVARSVVEPVQMTAEQVGELCDVLSNGQWNELSNAAWALNRQDVAIPSSVAVSALIPADEQR